MSAWSASMTPMTRTTKVRPSPSSHRSLHPYSSTRRMNSIDHSETMTERSRPEPSSSSTSSVLPSMVVAGAIWMGVAVSGIAPAPANAYYASDYASETVQTTVKDLKAAAGNVDETFKVYENVAGIITEGKGVGGMVNYRKNLLVLFSTRLIIRNSILTSTGILVNNLAHLFSFSPLSVFLCSCNCSNYTEGIQLERGYVADEDTQVYNPGLSLLTESEKERLVDAVIDARKVGLAKGQWSENNEFAFQFLREKLDPYHMQGKFCV